MEKLIDNITNVIKSMSEISSQWESLSEEEMTTLQEKYPFHKDLNELISDIIEWRE